MVVYIGLKKLVAYWMWNFITQVVHSWTHYYNPSYCLPNGICVPTGAALSGCKYYADIAKNNCSNGHLYTAYENLGYASHFMTDVGNPSHTGAELRQAILNGYITHTKIMFQDN